MEYLHKRVSLIVLIGWCFVLFGAGVTLFLGREGLLPLSENETVNGFFDTSEKKRPLDFSVTLKKFEKNYYPGGREWLLVFMRDEKNSVKLHVQPEVSYQVGNARVKIIRKSEIGEAEGLWVEVTGQTGRPARTWILAEPTEKSGKMDGELTFLYVPEKRMLRMVKGWIEIKERDNKASQFMLELAKPLYFRGYRFDLLENDPEGKKQTALWVRKDFGRVIVYTGLGALLSGVLFLWYLNPYFLPKDDTSDDPTQEAKASELASPGC